MDKTALPGPSGAKRRRSAQIIIPNKLTEEEMAAICEMSDYSFDEDVYSDKIDDVSESENDSDMAEIDECEDDNLDAITHDNRTPINTNNIVWSDPPLMNRQIFLFRGQTGLKQLPIGKSPVDYFDLLVDDSLYNLIVEQTNVYAEEIFLSSGKERARINDWKPLTKVELRLFLGLFLHMGTIKINRMQDYWKKHRLFNITGFSENMGRNRFLLILSCLHFAKNPAIGEVASNDRLYKIRPIINYFNEKMSAVYYPSKELSLDESLISWRDRSSFRQYLPGKRDKYGIKLYMLTEPNGISLRQLICTGGKDMTGSSGHASAVVLHLMEEKLDKGHALFMDSTYNSHLLASTLLKHETYCTGTIRANQKDNCADVFNKCLCKGEIIEKCDELNGIIMAKWLDKQDVVFISTEYSASLIEAQNKHGEAKLKPEAIIAYNKYMSGVDRKNKMLSYNASDQKTLLWYKRVFIHTLQTLLLNAWFLYNKYSGDKIDFYDFRLKIIEDLVPEKTITLKKSIKPTESVHLPSVLPKTCGKTQRKDCRVCRSRKNIRKMTNYCCEICTGNPGLCIDPCFRIWHEK